MDGDEPLVVCPGAMPEPPDGVEEELDVLGVDVDVVVVGVLWAVDVVVGVVCAVEVVVGTVGVFVLTGALTAAEDVLWLLPPHPVRASAPSSTPRTSVLMAYLLSGIQRESLSVGGCPGGSLPLIIATGSHDANL